jgi:hypothetical protein
MQKHSIADFFPFFFHQKVEKRSFYQSIFIFLYLIICVVALSWSALQPTLFRVHDFTHGARVAEMARAISEGQFPIRWSGNLTYGYGAPLFSFYAPLPYVVTGFVALVTNNLEWGVRLLFVLANVFVVTTAFWLGKRLYGPWGGVVLATVLSFAPYRSVNLYVRGAVSEAWALGFLPLIVIGIDQCWKRERAGFWILSVALAGLVLTHNLTALMVMPWLLIWSLCWPWIRDGVIHSWMPWRWGRALAMKAYIRELCVAVVAGFGLSAFYAIPALLENKLTQIQTIFQGYFFYALHFLYARQLLEPSWHYGGSGWGPQDGLSFFIGCNWYGDAFDIPDRSNFWIGLWPVVSSNSMRIIFDEFFYCHGRWNFMDGTECMACAGFSVGASLVDIYCLESLASNAFSWRH